MGWDQVVRFHAEVGEVGGNERRWKEMMELDGKGQVGLGVVAYWCSCPDDMRSFGLG